jgi:hypothetical protein
MLQLIKGLCKAVSSHFGCRDILEVNFAVLDLVLDVVIVDINVLCTLVMTLRGDKLDRRLIVAKELQWGNVCA